MANKLDKYYIGIDLGGMSAKAGLIGEDGSLHRIMRAETNANDGANSTAKKLAALAEELICECAIAKADVLAIGIGSPGVINSESGTVVNWSNFGWANVPLAELVAKEIGLPVYVTNDANAAALGEAYYGSGKKYADSVMITLGTGVGGGIVIGGKLIEGYRSAGAELGHTVIRKGGVQCTCGRRGCLECYASATALMRETKRAMQKNADSLMWKLSSRLEDVSGKTAFSAAQQGDRVAKRVVREYVASLGEGIVNVVNLLRPRVIILGGGVSNEGENLLKPLRRFVLRHIYAPASYAPLALVQATLGNDAGIYGAAQYAVQRYN